MVIYKAINQINGKVYIGQTQMSFKKRIKGHIDHMKYGKYISSFHNALRKYGKNNFVWVVLNECYDIDTLNQLEQYYIKYYGSMNREIGYNLNNGGCSYITSDDTKKKISKKATKRWEDPKYRKMMKENKPDFNGKNNPNYGNRWNDEQRDNLRQQKLGVPLLEETKKKVGKKGKDHWNYGKKSKNKRDDLGRFIKNE